MEYNLLFDILAKDHQDSVHVKWLSFCNGQLQVPGYHAEVFSELAEHGYITIHNITKREVSFTPRKGVSMKPTLVGSDAHKKHIFDNPLIGYIMVSDEDFLSTGVRPLIDVVYTTKLQMIEDLRQRPALSWYHGFASHRFIFKEGVPKRIKLYYPDRPGDRFRTIHLYNYSIQ